MTINYPQFINKSAINQLCEKLAQDFLLVQGAGGNISVKEEQTLWIKASGTWLAEAGRKDIFIPLSRAEVENLVAADSFSTIPTSTNESKLRPSIETWLHALMPQKFVVHLHALEILALLIRKGSQTYLNDLDFGDIRIGFTRYAKPGPDLAKAVAKSVKNNWGVEVLFLENHGIVVAAESIERINFLIKSVRDLASQKVIHQPQKHELPYLRDSQFEPVADLEVHGLAIDEKLLKLVKNAWAIAPDHVVFLGPEPVIFENFPEFESQIPQLSKLPLIVFISGQGVFSRGQLDAAGREQLRAYFELIIRQKDDQEFNTFSSSQIGELLNWDAEKYRIGLRK